MNEAEMKGMMQRVFAMPDTEFGEWCKSQMQVVMPGWKLVPIEPTKEMLEAVKPWPKHWTDEYLGANKPNAEAAYLADQAAAESMYRTMLAAAPERHKQRD